MDQDKTDQTTTQQQWAIAANTIFDMENDKYTNATTRWLGGRVRDALAQEIVACSQMQTRRRFGWARSRSAAVAAATTRQWTCANTKRNLIYTICCVFTRSELIYFRSSHCDAMEPNRCCDARWTQDPIHLLTHHLYAMAVERRNETSAKWKCCVRFSVDDVGVSEMSFRIQWIESNEIFTRLIPLSANRRCWCRVFILSRFSSHYLPSHIRSHFPFRLWIVFFWPYLMLDWFRAWWYWRSNGSNKFRGGACVRTLAFQWDNDQLLMQ